MQIAAALTRCGAASALLETQQETTQGGCLINRYSANPHMNEYEDVQVFTTGQVAKICQVAPRTVSKWFDTGRLAGYRIPGSQDRRIPRLNLIQFMQTHGMPLGVLAPVGPARVLLIATDSVIERQLQTDFERELELHVANSAFEAGSMTTHMKPHCVVLDLSRNTEEMGTVAIGMRRLLGADVAIVALTGEQTVSALANSALSEVFRAPIDAPLVAARIHHLATRIAMKVR